MIDPRTEPTPAIDQEVRFTAPPVLDEALTLFEPEDFRTSQEFPGVLFLFGMQRIHTVLGEPSSLAGHNQSNRSVLDQYRQAAEVHSANGKREFRVLPGVREFRYQNKGALLRAVGMRIQLDTAGIGTLLKPPLYGPGDSRVPTIGPIPTNGPRPTNTLGAELHDKALKALVDARDEEFKTLLEEHSKVLKELTEVREKGWLEVVYELQKKGGDHDLALANLRSVLGTDVRVSGLTVVAHEPSSARYNDRFQTGGKKGRFYVPPLPPTNVEEGTQDDSGPTTLEDLANSLDDIERAS